MRTAIRLAAALLALASAVASAQQGESPHVIDAASTCTMPGQEAFRRALPAEQELGTVRFRTGGIGVDEARAMREARTQYPLALTFVEHFGGKDRFLAGILVEIHRDDGTPVLCATSDGPYMFVDLPPGEYRVSATTGGGRMIERKTRIAVGAHRELSFVWPASASAH